MLYKSKQHKLGTSLRTPNAQNERNIDDMNDDKFIEWSANGNVELIRYRSNQQSLYKVDGIMVTGFASLYLFYQRYVLVR